MEGRDRGVSLGKILSQHLPGQTEENREIPRSG